MIDDKLQAITGVVGTDKFIDNWVAGVRKKAHVWDKWCSENQPKLSYRNDILCTADVMITVPFFIMRN